MAQCRNRLGELCWIACTSRREVVFLDEDRELRFSCCYASPEVVEEVHVPISSGRGVAAAVIEY